MPSEKLKYVMQEIKEILVKHDVAGIISICSGENVEFANVLDPSWCDLFYDLETVPGAVSVRFRSRSKDYPGSLKQIQQTRVEDTANMVFNLQEVTALQFQMLDHVANMIKSGVEITGRSEAQIHDHQGTKVKPQKGKSNGGRHGDGPDLTKLGL